MIGRPTTGSRISISCRRSEDGQQRHAKRKMARNMMKSGGWHGHREIETGHGSASAIAKPANQCCQLVGSPTRAEDTTHAPPNDRLRAPRPGRTENHTRKNEHRATHSPASRQAGSLDLPLCFTGERPTICLDAPDSSGTPRKPAGRLFSRRNVPCNSPKMKSQTPSQRSTS